VTAQTIETILWKHTSPSSAIAEKQTSVRQMY